MGLTVKSLIVASLATACGGRELDRGTFEPASWPEMNERPTAIARASLTTAEPAPKPWIDQDKLSVLVGDESLISGIDGALGLRFDDERNDLAAVATRVSSTIGDRRAVLVLFTTFDDVGAAGPAYYVPFWSTTTGLGRAPIDQRADFGVQELIGIANMKRYGNAPSGMVLPRLLHETAHRDLAYLAAEIEGSTVAVPLLGRQHAHWHAALHTEGSVLGGYDWLEIGPGEFSVQKVNDGYSPLDLYGLGLLAPSEVRPFFYIRNMRNVRGFAIPAEAELTPGTHVFGERVTVTIEDVIRASGERQGDAQLDSNLDLLFVLLTAPGESATSTRAMAARADIEGAIDAFAGLYAQKTRSAGTVCPYAGGCNPHPNRDILGPEECGCSNAGPQQSPSTLLLLIMLLLVFRRIAARSDPDQQETRMRAVGR